MDQQHQFTKGDTVYEVTSPHVLMLITNQKGAIYYCKQINGRNKEPLAFMKRDLKVFEKA